LTIPDTVEGLPVRSIGAGAFSGNLTLASVELPDGVTTIGESAFSGCTSLTRLHLGPRLTSIGNQAFQGCQGLTSLRLSPSLTSIGSSAFSGCSGLTGLVVPERVATVGANAFSGCTGLGHALLEGDAPDAFDVDGAAPGFSVFFRKDRTGYTAPAWKGHRAVGIDGRHENLTYASDGVSLTINGFTGLGGRVVIPETIDGLPVREISGAFFERRDLTSVIVPAGVTSLSARAFFDCRSLSCLVFEGNAPHVSNSDVFPGASGRFTIYFHKESTGFDAPLWDPYRKLTIDGRDGDYTYSLDGGTATVNGYIGPGGSVTIPDNIRGVPVARMENQLFMWNLRVTDVSIPDSVTSIGSRAFQECENLTRVTIGNGVTSIGFWAFANCWNLTELTIGTSVRFIDYWAFADCRRLFRVVIPDSVETISQGAFFECANLVDVMIGKGVTSIGDSAFSRSPDLIRATFAGNAPDTLGESIFSGASLSFTVNYSSESTGFTSPTWQGYASVALETPAPTPLQTWRWQHFGDQATNSGEAADSADPDGDGSTNLEEFAAGTDPKSVAGDFQILRTNLNGTTFIVTIRALPGRLYELQRLIPAADPSWHAVDTTGPIEAATAVMLIDPAAPSRDAIYRVVCKLLL